VSRCKLEGFPTVLRSAIDRSNVDCWFCSMNHGVSQLKSHDCQISIGHSSTERMSGDICFKKLLGYYMELMLQIISCCTVSLTIPILSTVKRQILLYSR